MGKFFVKILLILLFAWLLFYLAENLAIYDTISYKTAGSEKFIQEFYQFFAVMISILFTCLLYRKLWFIGYFIAIIISIRAIFQFGETGRGRFDHIDYLIGGSLQELSLYAIGLSDMLEIIFYLTIFIFSFCFLHQITFWVKYGKFTGGSVKKFIVKIMLFYALLLLPIASLPLGFAKNKQDVEQAQKYIENIAEYADSYHILNEEYPRQITEYMESIEDTTPLLLQIHDYLSRSFHDYIASDLKGSFYLSRPQKYCFVFLNASYPYGYYSTTSDRGWQFYQTTDSLEHIYPDVCDEPKEASSIELLSEHLGLKTADDPLAEIEFLLGQQPPPPAQTPSTTGKLQEKLKEIFNKPEDGEKK